MKQMAVISGTANRPLAEAIVLELNFRFIPDRVTHLTETKIMRFRDGEVYCSIEETVRGSDVFIIQPTCSPANDNLMELLLIVDAARRASAGSITAVIPYFGYARQDRKVAKRDPISAKLVATMLEAAGVDRIITMDLHAKQIQGFFNIPVDNLSAASYFADYFREQFDPEAVCIVSPDFGGVARARKIAEKMGVANIAIIDKNRSKANECEVMHIIGDVKGKHCIMFDDIIDTAGTLCKAADALYEAGCGRVVACATHAVLSDGAVERIAKSRLDEVHVLDTIPQSLMDEDCYAVATQHRSARMFAEAITGVYFDTAIGGLCV